MTAGGANDDYAHPSFALKIAGTLRKTGPETWIEPNQDSLIACMESLIEKRAPDLNPAAGVTWIAENFSWAKSVDKLMALFDV